MKLKFSSKPFDIQSDKVTLYPKSELTFVANLTMIFAIIVLVIIILVTKDVHMLMGFLVPLFVGAVVLYIYGAQELVFDIKRREIHRKTFVHDKYLGSFCDVSHIEMIIHPGYNIAHYRCFLKRAPNGMGIKLTVNYKEDNEYFATLSNSVIPILLSVIPDDGQELVIPPKTIHDIVFFRRIGNRLFSYKYLDYPAFFVILAIFIVFFLLPLFTGSGYFFILSLIPVFLLFRRSWVIIDRDQKSVFTSFWWGLVRRRFSYTDIKILGVATHNARGGMLGGSSIFAVRADGSLSMLIKKMLMEERVPRLLQEIEVLMKHPEKNKN